jgi:hypothetical protein
MQSRRFCDLPLIGLLAIAYFIAGKLGLMLASLHASASPVWPPAGIALAATLCAIKLDKLEAAIERAIGPT